jgi:Protein of unknown function (DUF2835)
MHYIFDLNIPRDEVLKFYAGDARQVHAVARGGQRVRFPAAVLRPYVATEGVRGTFRMSVNATHRLERFERLG